MKSPFTLILTLLLSVNLATAQTQTNSTVSNDHASFGIFGGINFQNLNGQDIEGNKLTNSLVTRFHVGIIEDIPIAPEFYTQIGVQFISKGTEGSKMYNDNTGAHLITREINMNYLELLLNLAYKPLVGSGHLIVGFGPYVGYSISGKAMFKGNGNTPSDSDLQYQKSVPSGADNNLIYFKRWDVGSNFFFGYEFANGVNIVFNSQLGLININSETDSEIAEKNTGFGLSLGYKF